MIFSIRTDNPHRHYIQIEARFQLSHCESFIFQLSSWRPGRYELGNFAKNVRKFKVLNSWGEELNYQKINKDRWEIFLNKSSDELEEFTIQYEYFGVTLDAGSSFLDHLQLYINPVNCLGYVEALKNQPIQLYIHIPDHYNYGGALKINKALSKNQIRVLEAHDFEHLADSPFIFSPELKSYSFKNSKTEFFIHINGSNSLDIDRFIKDVNSYTETQTQIFGELPCDDYHYLIHFLPWHYRHGVEHSNSTVIVEGPGNEFHTEENYRDLLAICSHELFHLWNIKRIRPSEMWPYDYTKENYSKLGYVYEGITTYYGDYALLKSKVFSFQNYLEQFNKDLQRHFDNEGRYNYSVAESSWDTWLDGYVPGSPGRKVSIYVEGMLSALWLDLSLRLKSSHQINLDLFMRDLYENTWKINSPYTEELLHQIISSYDEEIANNWFQLFVHGKAYIEKLLPEILLEYGLVLEPNTSPLFWENNYGMKISFSEKYPRITHVLEGSNADLAGISTNVHILSINGIDADDSNTQKDLFKGNDLLLIKTPFDTRLIQLNSDQKNIHYQKWELKKIESASETQKTNFENWSGHKFD